MLNTTVGADSLAAGSHTVPAGSHRCDCDWQAAEENWLDLQLGTQKVVSLTPSSVIVVPELAERSPDDAPGADFPPDPEVSVDCRI